MKFAVLSDTHYISRRMIADKDDKELMLQPAVSEQAVLQAAQNSDVLFITGDITDSGDRYSHEDYAEFLRGVKERGKRIYVIFATHDYHHHKAYVRRYGEKTEFRADPWNKPYFNKDGFSFKTIAEDCNNSLTDEECAPGLVEALSPEEIWELWKDFGPDEAYSVHESSFSYCIDLDESTRVLMLNDIFRNEEALKEISPTYSPSCFRWIKKMYDEAERDGKFIFVCSHHPMLPAVPGHRVGAGRNNRDMRSPVVAQTLADIGIKLSFTGHSHFCDVGHVKSDKGNLLCSVTVPGVRFYPPAYREVDLDGLNGRIKYNCVYVDTPAGCEIEETTLFEHYHQKFRKEFTDKLTGNDISKRLFEKATVKDIVFLVRKKAAITKAEEDSFKDVKLLDFLLEIGFNMLIGDGSFTPKTPEYRIMMALSAKLDSIIDTQPFVDVRKKYLHGYSISEMMEPMLFNNSTPDREAEIDFTVTPVRKMKTPVFTSHAGDVLMAVVYALTLLLSASAPAVAAIGVPALVIKKKLSSRKSTNESFNKYYL